MKILLALLMLMRVAYAHPPEHQHYEWFRKQHSVEGRWCCNESDGHSLLDTEWRIQNGLYQIKVDNVWITIPTEKMIKPGDPNPTGMAAAWYIKAADGKLHLYCFAPGPLY